MDLYYKSGALYRREIDGKKEYFYEDGALKTIERYKEGRLDGESVLYWPNGKMKRRSFFQKGARHGLDQIWNEEGVLVDEGHYDAGKCVGIHHRYDRKGQLIEEIEYLDGPRFNMRQWDAKGALRLEAVWRDSTYREKAWDRFQNIWIEKEGIWDGRKLVYV